MGIALIRSSLKNYGVMYFASPMLECRWKKMQELNLFWDCVEANLLLNQYETFFIT